VARQIINIVLGPLLIFGVGPFPRLGVTGAAIATTFGRSVGATYAVVRLFRHASRVPVARRHLRLDFGVMRQILDLSGSATIQNLIGMASWLGLVRILAGYGSDALAGYTIAVRLIIFALLPSGA
jgi:Na+-driven multidrug efflux pump